MMPRKKLNFLTIFYLFVCLKAIQCQDKVKLNDCAKCVHGHCDEQNRCGCLPHFGGENCDKSKFYEFILFVFKILLL